MKTFKPCRRKGVLPVIITITILAFLNPLFGASKKDVSKFESIAGSNDIRGFKSAFQMYHTAAVKPYDREAAQLIAQMNKLLENEKLSLESKEVRPILEQLNTYRTSKEVQEAVREWKTLLVSRVKAGKYPKPGTNAKIIFNSANSYYKKLGSTKEDAESNLKTARRKYMEILDRYPTHLDARSNLALSELHLGNDLTAQLHLEVTRELSPGYAPAMINLTVVYERLRRSKQAEKLAHDTRKRYPQLPQAAYNAAWYFEKAGNFEQAKNLLKPLALARKPNSKYSNLRILNDRQLRNPAGSSQALAGDVNGEVKKDFWKQGIAGVWGGKTAWWAWILSILVFLFCSALAVPIWAGLCMGASKKKTTPFFTSLAVGGFLFILAWGISAGWVWVLVIIYGILFSVLSNEVAKNG